MTIPEIEAEVRALLARLNQPRPDFRLDRQTRGDGTPHVEGDGPIYDVVIDADGREQSRESGDGYEVVYILMRRMTRIMAMREEERTRSVLTPGWMGDFGARLPRPLALVVGREDYSRETWIDAHVRLMDHLRGDWGGRIRDEHDRILRRYPLTADERQHSRRLDLSAYGL